MTTYFLGNQEQMTTYFLGHREQMTTYFLGHQEQMTRYFLGNQEQMTTYFLGNQEQMTTYFRGNQEHMTTYFLGNQEQMTTYFLEDNACVLVTNDHVLPWELASDISEDASEQDMSLIEQSYAQQFAAVIRQAEVAARPAREAYQLQRKALYFHS